MSPKAGTARPGGAAMPPLISPAVLAWQDGASCAQVDPGLFFPGDGVNAGPAKRVCARCPVRAECLEYALATDQRYGVWGGMSERQRRRLVQPVQASPRVREGLAA